MAITYHTDGQRSRNYLLPMVTDDGEVWTLETSVMESRQRPVTSFSSTTSSPISGAMCPSRHTSIPMPSA